MPIPLTINMDVHKYVQLGEYIKVNHKDLIQYIDLNPTVIHSMISIPMNVYHIIADTLFYQMEYDMAEPMYRALVFRCFQIHGEESEKCIPIIEKFVDCLHNLFQMGFTEKLEEIEPSYKQIIALKIKYLGKNHYSTINSIIDMASFYTYMSRYTDAMTLFEGIISVHHKVVDINYVYFLNTMLILSDKLLSDGYVNRYGTLAHQMARVKGIVL